MPARHLHYWMASPTALKAALCLTLAGLTVSLPLGGEATAAAPSAARPGVVAAAAPPGFSSCVGSIATGVSDLQPFDITQDSHGDAYLAWIDHDYSGGTDVLHVSEIEPYINNCLAVDDYSEAISPVSGSDSRVQVIPNGPGDVSMVWMSDSGSKSNVTAAELRNGSISTPQESSINFVPGYQLLDAKRGPDGKIWSVVGGPADVTHVYVLDGGSQFASLTSPYSAPDARLAFTPSGGIVLAVVPQNMVTKPVEYTQGDSTHDLFQQFSPVAHTWNRIDAFGLIGGPRGVHLVASTDSSTYHPVVGAFSGTSFGPVQATGDANACAPESHDLATDASGRIADVSEACNRLRLANLPDDAHEGYVDLPSGGVLASGQPQLTTAADGTGWVAWAIEDGSDGDTLKVARVVLPAALASASEYGSAGSVTVTGPRSCLPPVDVHVAARAKPAHHWKAGQPTLRLGSQPLNSSTLHGASLASGRTYTLTASSHFTKHVVRHHKKHGKTHTVKQTLKKTLVKSLTFRAC